MSSGLWNLVVFYAYDNVQEEYTDPIFKAYLHPVDGSRFVLENFGVRLQTCTMSSQNTKNWKYPTKKT
jgi:hypothetical protein